jgi:hypothetical protein
MSMAPPVGVPDRAAAIVARHAPVAAVMNEFFSRLQDESRDTPYPVDALDHADGHATGPLC